LRDLRRSAVEVGVSLIGRHRNQHRKAGRWDEVLADTWINRDRMHHSRRTVSDVNPADAGDKNDCETDDRDSRDLSLSHIGLPAC
jgi:hypothetical protein